MPTFNWSETFYLPVATVTPTYIQKVMALTGKTNAGAFRSFAIGEVLFLGASGSRRGAEDWAITFKFAASRNATGLTIGGITGVAKGGWEYLWVMYADAEDSGHLVKQPVGVYVERVYDSGNYADLGIGS